MQIYRRLKRARLEEQSYIHIRNFMLYKIFYHKLDQEEY